MSWLDRVDLAELLIFSPRDVHHDCHVPMSDDIGASIINSFMNGGIDEETKRKWETFSGQKWREFK
jgi:hypothetical protein